ncbi:MAG: response regulator [Chitinivibrionales bacterium]|nr:response regulator [Chitinivibrionales bacterium]MBD3396837.1 response regulator [Chitinivibrionales bacterium]
MRGNVMAMSRKKVLWVDDEIEFLRSHIMFLETRGYSVTPVFNGDDALHILHEQPEGFDIVLLDEQMPGKDGLTVLEEVKDFLPDLPVVMVTKSEEEQVMEDALGMKIDGYLTKPVNPSQILSVCKRLLHSRQIISSQVSQRFVRSFSETRTALQSPLDAPGYMSIYESLVKWDFELEKVEDEGIRQTHAGQKSDADVQFGNYYIENYMQWLNDKTDAPVLSPDVLRTYVAPRLKAGERVYLMVFDCMRLDQFMAVEPLLKKHFNVERHTYCTTIPSSSSYTRAALFGGTDALDIATRHPDLWKARDSHESGGGTLEETLLRENLAREGLELGDALQHSTIRNMADSQEVLGKVGDWRDKRLVSMDINFVDMLIQSRDTSTVIQEIAPDEPAFRRLTHSWFQYSNVYQVLKELSRQECTVILTTSNGSVLCTRGTEIYGDTSTDKNLRYRFGDKITCDERHALFISEPARFKLPAATPETVGIILKENYYFILHDKFENYQKQYSNTFQHGGISMQEIIVPLAVLTPR